MAGKTWSGSNQWAADDWHLEPVAKGRAREKRDWKRDADKEGKP